MIRQPDRAFFEKAISRRKELRQQHGVDMSLADELLQTAYDERDDEALLMAVSEGADPNIMASDWVTPLRLQAIYDGRFDVLELLLNAGADPMGQGADVLYELCENGNAAVLRMVLQVHRVSPQELQDYVICAAENGNLDCLLELKAAGADLLADDGRALCYACCYNHHAVVEYLVHECGADLELELDDWSPLFYAARGNALESAGILLAAGADPLHRDIADGTPLQWAASPAMESLLDRYIK